jgi:hypothetical protein
MDVCDAIEVVLKLARERIVQNGSPDKQRELSEVCDFVEDFAVNHLGED